MTNTFTIRTDPWLTNLKVGQRITLTIEAFVTAIEAEHIDNGHGGLLPGETTITFAVFNAKPQP
jgi:hypothetical protein